MYLVLDGKLSSSVKTNIDVPELSYRHAILGHWRKKARGCSTSTRKDRGPPWDGEAPGSAQLGLQSPFTVTELRKMFPSLGECPCREHLSHLPHCTETTTAAGAMEGQRQMWTAVACLLTERSHVGGASAVQNGLLHRSRAVLFQRRAARE